MRNISIVEPIRGLNSKAGQVGQFHLSHMVKDLGGVNPARKIRILLVGIEGMVAREAIDLFVTVLTLVAIKYPRIRNTQI